MIAFLIIVYTAVVVVLFKVLHIKPTAYVIASMIVAGVFMIGGVVVVWSQAAPITDKMVTSQYVVQLVPYVKGQVKAVHAQALQPMKKGDLLLEIDPAPYQYTVNQVEAQLACSTWRRRGRNASRRTQLCNKPKPVSHKRRRLRFRPQPPCKWPRATCRPSQPNWTMRDLISPSVR